MPRGDMWSKWKVTDLYQLSVWPRKSTDASVYLESVFWRQAYDQHQCASTDNSFVFEKGKVTKSSLLFKKNTFYCRPWTRFSRPVIKIWNLKCTYEPADLMCSEGNVYNCMPSWTILHILLVVLPLRTSPHTLFRQETLSNAKLTNWDHTDCINIVYLFNL